MKHILTWCEIPVTDMNRAKDFYSKVLNVNFIDQEMDAFQMALFSEDPELISGALIQADMAQPSMNGTTAYLNAGEDLAPSLERAVALGSEVIFPKTPIKDGEEGYFAQVTDCEGNRVGLYSLN